MKVTKEDRLKRIEKLIEQLQGCSDREKIARSGEIEHDWLFDNYPASSAGTFISSEYIPALDRAFPASDGDELGCFEIWQKVNGELIKRHLVVETLKPTKEEWDKRNQPVIESTVTRVNGKLPLDPQSLIKKAESMLSSDSWATVAAALILLTGRRPAEIAWCGKFSPSGEKSLLFNGQLKKGEIETEPFEIPTLIDAERVFQAYNRLRYLQQTKTKILRIASAKEAASKTNNQINLAIRKHFSDDLQVPIDRKRKTKQLSAGNLRAAYGKIAAHFYCPDDCEPILYVGRILGHQCEKYSTESLATTIHYYTYRIIDDENVSLPNVPSADRTLEQVTNSEVRSRPTDEVTNSEVRSRPTEVRSRPTDEVTNSEVRSRPTDEVTNSEVRSRPTDEVTNSTVNDLPEEVTDSPVNDRNSGEVTNFPVNDRNSGEVTDSQINDRDLLPKDAISGTMLAARLGVQLPTVGRNRKKGEDRFLEWSGKLDPDGISWKFVKRGKLKSTGHNRNVDIYIPIGNLNISNKVTQIEKGPENVDRKILNKLSRIASQLDLGASNPTEQLSNLLGWVETKLNEEETREQLYRQSNKEELLTSAIESLTEQVKRASDIIESNLLPIQEITSNQKPVPEQKAEELDPDTAPNPVVLAAKKSRSEKLARDDRTTETLIRLETEELKSTIEALNTSIALKQSAIIKEKKKRSKANTDTIELWEKEIRSLKRSIEFLNSQ